MKTFIKLIERICENIGGDITVIAEECPVILIAGVILIALLILGVWSATNSNN